MSFVSKETMNEINGILFIDKPSGWTSRDVCNKVQSILHTKKVGHLGTLDPFATGLLIVAVGKATRILPFLENLDKTYIATLKLGVKTSSGDLDGTIVEQQDVKVFPTQNEIVAALQIVQKMKEQRIPLASAKKIDGKRLYEYAHQNIVIQTPSKPIEIYDLLYLNSQKPTIDFLTRVSAGTYVRTIGEDIALQLGTIGHLSALRRVRIGDYSVEKAIEIENISENNLQPIGKILSFLPTISVDSLLAQKIQNGLPLSNAQLKAKSDKILIVDEQHRPLAIYRKDGEIYRCVRGLW